MLDDLGLTATDTAPSPGSERPVSARALRSVVVVGAGLGGARTVAALRAHGFEGHVTVLGSEDVEPYDRPPLSKELLTRTQPAWLREELGLDLALAEEVHLGESAVGLVVDTALTVRTARRGIEADAVVLATGSRPVRPPGWESAMTLHTPADAARLRAALVPGSRLVVVGAGWIGAEVAGVAAAAGVHVTVVEAASCPLAAALGPTVGAMTARWYDAAGVRLLTGHTVARVDEGAVELLDGEVLPADVVLAAVGARPVSGWLEPTLPLEVGGTLAVDEAYRVLGTDGAPVAGGAVLAVGDLAWRRSPRHGWVPGGHWDGALRGPDVAVRSLLGLTGSTARGTAGGAGSASSPGDDDPAPYVFSTQLGHELALYGHPSPLDEVVVRGDADGAFTALWFTPGSDGSGDSSGDELTAVLAVDRPRDVAAARRLFTGPALPRLDRTVAADPDRPLTRAVR